MYATGYRYYMVSVHINVVYDVIYDHQFSNLGQENKTLHLLLRCNFVHQCIMGIS